MTLLLTEHSLSAFKAFTLLSVLSNFQTTVTVFIAESLRFIADGRSALVRMQRLIERKSVTTYEMDHRSNKPSSLEVHSKGRRYKPQFIRVESFRHGKPILINAQKFEEFSQHIRHPKVDISNVSCFWSHNSDRPVLEHLSLSATSGQLLGVTGPIGSGKTSLLLSILGELPVSGEISCIGKMAYVSQTPWVFSGTVRENIVFGKQFNQEKFNKIIDVCNLGKDIESFPNRDLTEIGQRGVILSGGQRARVSLARAIYSDADIYLLDDPLSAVDAKVGKHLFDRCIKDFLAGRVRIMVTHQVQFLKHTDNVLVLQDGSVVYRGAYCQMEQGRKDGFSFISQQLDSNGKESKNDVVSVGAIGETSKYATAAPKKKFERVDLEIEKEDRTVGAVKWRLYWKYFRTALSVFLILTLAVFFAVVQGIIYLFVFYLV